MSCPRFYNARGRQKYRAGRRPTEPVGGKGATAALWDVYKKNRSLFSGYVRMFIRPMGIMIEGRIFYMEKRMEQSKLIAPFLLFNQVVIESNGIFQVCAVRMIFCNSANQLKWSKGIETIAAVFTENIHVDPC